MAMECPKRPPSGYWIWLSDVRDQIAKEIGSTRGPDVSKAAGVKWKGLADTKKVPYEKKAAEAKKEYEIAMAKFKQAGGVPEPRKRKADKQGGKRKKVKDPNAPKKPAGGGYGQYLNEHRASIMNALPAGANKLTDTAKKAGEQWKALPEKDRSKYEALFKKKMEEYKVAMSNYAPDGGDGKEEDEDDDDDDDGDDDDGEA